MTLECLIHHNGLCCKNCLEGEQRAGALVRGSPPEQLGDDTMLAADLPLGEPRRLACAEPVPRVIALKGPRGCGVCPHPAPRGPTALPPAVLFFHPSIHLLGVSEQAGLRAGAVVLEGGDGRGGRVGEAGRPWPQKCSAASASRVGPRLQASVAPGASTAR